MAVLALGGGVVRNSLFESNRATGILGGPIAAEASQELSPAVARDYPLESLAVPNGVSRGASAGIYENAAVFPAAVYGAPVPGGSDDGIIRYTVSRGDTLSGIADRFRIDIPTIISANPGLTKKTVKPGRILAILPVSGFMYDAKDDDTIDSISQKFSIPAEQLFLANPGLIPPFSAMRRIIIPKVAEDGAQVSVKESLPDLMMPAEGKNWGILHAHNAVDIANSCGTPVVAAAAGTVISDPAYGDGGGEWNGGYGKFLFLEHEGGIRTRYAHIADAQVSLGDTVKKGQKIATMGDTGVATGCHLHFEVYGAANPFAKK